MNNKRLFFSFGRNWLDFVNHSLDDQKMEIAYNSLLKYLPADEYKDKVFIDIGCGSGIFSLSALRLGCKEVISFDYDEYSIRATETMKEKFSSLIPGNARWNIFKGNILDNKLVESLNKKGDIVYSWGVLHHTGSMYEALRNTMTCVRPQGYLIIAIYNKAPYSDLWVKVKKTYNQSSRPMKLLYVYATLAWIYLERFIHVIKAVVKGEKRTDFKGNDDYRGMSFFYNIIDWLGGFPYEYASFDEVKTFVENEGFDLVRATVKWLSLSKEEYKRSVRFLGRFFYSYLSNYTGTNEFIFKRKTGRTNEQD
ncbi:MAG: class I SAM-dependent methyltransferase [Nitrospirota bacterium]